MEQSISLEKNKLQTALNQDMTQELSTQEAKEQWLQKPQELGFVNKGSGQHQSNTVYGIEGIARCLTATDYKAPLNILEAKQCKND